MNMKAKQRNKQAARLVSIAFTQEGWEDYRYWQDVDPDTLLKINDLIDSCMRTPFAGIGKPEALKGDLSGFWSRRINQKDRLVYLFESGTLTVLQCRFHYDDK